MRIHKPLHQGSHLNASSIPTKSYQIIIPKSLTADLLFGAAALAFARAKLLKIQAAGYLVLVLLPSAMDRRIVVGRVSITSSGPRPDLVVVVGIKARAPTLTAHSSLHVPHQQMVRRRLGHPRMGIIVDSRTGINREQTSGLNHHRRVTPRRLCRLQRATHRLLQTRAQSSVSL